MNEQKKPNKRPMTKDDENNCHKWLAVTHDLWGHLMEDIRMFRCLYEVEHYLEKLYDDLDSIVRDYFPERYSYYFDSDAIDGEEGFRAYVEQAVEERHPVCCERTS